MSDTERTEIFAPRAQDPGAALLTLGLTLLAAAAGRDQPRSPILASFNGDIFDLPEIGAPLAGRAWITRATRDAVFVSAEARQADQLVATFCALFRLGQ